MILTHICGIMSGKTTSEEEAKKCTQMMENCPYLLFGGFSSSTFFYVFLVPEMKKWWLEYPVENPQVIGAEDIQLELVRNIVKPKNFDLILPEYKSKISPCGSSCENCPMRLESQCNACPASIYYKKSE
ncbi:MAG: hypothetical protein ACFFFH_10875 [Candidatus Thorarchaeota archaeon]